MSVAVLNSRFLTRLLTSGEEYIDCVSVLKEDISSTACELTMLIFVHVCYNHCGLFEFYIFNYEIMPAALASTFVFIYNVVY